MTTHTVVLKAREGCYSRRALLTGMEKSLGDYSFSGLSSSKGEEGSLAEQAAQSAAASTFEVISQRVKLWLAYSWIFASPYYDPWQEVMGGKVETEPAIPERNSNTSQWVTLSMVRITISQPRHGL